MKISEMDARQKRAYKNVYWAARDLIGGLENTMQDNSEDSEEYKGAQAELSNHAGLVERIYGMAITDVYDEGFAQVGKAAAAYMKDVRFCGKDWILQRVENQVVKLGY